MKWSKDTLKKFAPLMWLAGAVLLFLFATATVYHKGTDTSVMLDASDAPLFSVIQIQRMLGDGHFAGGNPWVGLGSFAPILISDYTAACYYLLPAVKCEEAIMAIGVFLSCLFMYLFLREKGFSRWAALVAGLSWGVCTCLVSLSKAGHTGKFTGVAYVSGALWLMQKSINGKHPFWGIFAGLFIGYAFAQARDLIIIIMTGVGSYWVFEGVRTAFIEKSIRWTRILTVYVLAGIVSVLVMLPVYSMLGSALGGEVDGLDSGPELVTQSLPAVYPIFGSALIVKESGRTPEEQWDWATQWSLPADEIPKLAVPSFCGYHSWHTNAPYWGRMGRDARWTPLQGPNGRNFTQTNEYLGISVLCLALIGLVVGIMKLVRRERSGPFNDVPFWAGVGLLALILAFGRYGFLYRIFYSLPMMSSFRNPVKFMHVVSLAVTILCAHGVEAIVALIRARKWTSSQVLVVLLPVVAVLLVLVLSLAASPWEGSDFVGSLRREGYLIDRHQKWSQDQMLSNYKSAMMSGMLRSLGLTALVAFSIGVGLIAAKKMKGAAPAVCSLLLALTVGFDLVGVNRKYIDYHDPWQTYRSNAVMDYLMRFPEHRVKFFPHNWFVFNQWNSVLVPYLKVKSADMPAESRRRPDIQAFHDSLAAQPAKKWGIMGVKNLVIPRDENPRAQDRKTEMMMLGALGEARGDVRGFTVIDMATGDVVPPRFVQDQREAICLVAENKAAIPFGKWYGKAEYLSLTNMFARLPQPDFDISKTLLVDAKAEGLLDLQSESGTPSGSSELLDYRDNRATLRVSSTSDGWVFLNDYIDGQWEFTVDGDPVECYRANGIFMAVPVPAGEHEVVMSFAGSEMSFWMPIGVVVSLLALFAVYQLGSAVLLRRRKSEE